MNVYSSPLTGWEMWRMRLVRELPCLEKEAMLVGLSLHVVVDSKMGPRESQYQVSHISRCTVFRPPYIARGGLARRAPQR